MACRLKKTDCDILRCIADHRILTVSQVAAAFHKSRQVIRRRLRSLEKEGWLEALGCEFGRGRGRPEKSLGLTERGAELLKEKGLLDKDVSYEGVQGDGLFGAEHQLLLNWFRIRLKQIEQTQPRLTVKLIAHNSPFSLASPDGRILISDCSPVPGSKTKGVKFTPDAVFTIAEKEAGKTCLFFLEVDCGTETIASPKRDMTDIRQKIVNYQWYFHGSCYKRYEQVFGASLRGFRLLFLTGTHGRLAALCKLTREMRPSNFIWLTECDCLFADGAGAAIWAQGGDLQSVRQSICGSLCRSVPSL